MKLIMNIYRAGVRLIANAAADISNALLGHARALYTQKLRADMGLDCVIEIAREDPHEDGFDKYDYDYLALDFMLRLRKAYCRYLKSKGFEYLVYVKDGMIQILITSDAMRLLYDEIWRHAYTYQPGSSGAARHLSVWVGRADGLVERRPWSYRRRYAEHANLAKDVRTQKEAPLDRVMAGEFDLLKDDETI